MKLVMNESIDNKDRVQQEEGDDVDEEVRAELFTYNVNMRKAWEQSAKEEAFDKFRLSVRAKARDRARAARGPPSPSSPPNQEYEDEEEDLFFWDTEEDSSLCDVVDDYSAKLIPSLYINNIHPRLSESRLRELVAHGCRDLKLYLPKDRASRRHQGYCFADFQSLLSSRIALGGLYGSVLYGKRIGVFKTIQVKENSLDAGVNLFVVYLDPDMDENKLCEILSRHRVIAKNIKIMKDPETGRSLGSAFLNFDSFEAFGRGIEAIRSINEKTQYGRPVRVFYACMEGTDSLKGSILPRSSNPNTQKSRRHTQFASGPPRPSFGQLNGAAPQVSTTFTRPPLPQHAHRYPSMQMSVPPQFPQHAQMSVPPPQWQQMGQGMPPQQFLPPTPNWPQMMNWPPQPPAGTSSQQMAVPPQYSAMPPLSQHTQMSVPPPQWHQMGQQPQGVPPQQFWPPPPPAGMSGQHVGWAPPLPQQLPGGHGHHSMMQMSMQPPPNAQQPPPPPSG